MIYGLGPPIKNRGYADVLPTPLYQETCNIKQFHFTVVVFSELGSTVLGLKCEDIMNLEYYDVEEAITTINLYTDMPPDMVKYLQFEPRMVIAFHAFFKKISHQIIVSKRTKQSTSIVPS